MRYSIAVVLFLVLSVNGFSAIQPRVADMYEIEVKVHPGDVNIPELVQFVAQSPMEQFVQVLEEERQSHGVLGSIPRTKAVLAVLKTGSEGVRVLIDFLNHAVLTPQPALIREYPKSADLKSQAQILRRLTRWKARIDRRCAEVENYVAVHGDEDWKPPSYWPPSAVQALQNVLQRDPMLFMNRPLIPRQFQTPKCHPR